MKSAIFSFIILLGSAKSIAMPLSGHEVYNWKVNSCGPILGLDGDGNDSDLSVYSTLKIDFRNEKDCTLNQITQNVLGSTSQEYSNTQLPPKFGWVFGCVNQMSESSQNFRLYSYTTDAHFIQDELNFVYVSAADSWKLKHRLIRKSSNFANQRDFIQECDLTLL